MKRNHAIRVTLSALLLLALLAGCAGGPKGSSGPEGAISAPEPSPEASPETVLEPSPKSSPEPSPEAAPKASPAPERDWAGLYLSVLEDLWNTDPGLNTGAVYVSVDLSDAPGDLTETQRTEIAEAFAARHQAEGLALSYGALADQGYLTPLSGGGYQWEDGVLFAIRAGDGGTFDAEKWRSPLGAYFFMDCTAEWAADGGFSYGIGGAAIS